MAYQRVNKKKINKIISLVFLCLLLVSCDKKHDFSNQLYDINYNLIDTKNKWLVINYWAIWCPSCRTEVPELNNLNKQLPNNIQMIGVNYDKGDDEKIITNSKLLGINFLVLNERSAIFLTEKLPKPKGLPATYIIDNKGKIRAILIGEQTKDSLNYQLVKLKAIK